MNTLLLVIPKDVPPFSLICYTNFKDTKYIINSWLDIIDIQIKGEDEKYINLMSLQKKGR